MDEFHYFPFKTKPYDHQRDYLETYADAEYHALFWEMGSGKTKAIIDNVAYLHDIGELDVFILIALKGVHTNWPLREIPTHMPEHVIYNTFTWSNQRSTKKWAEDWKSFKEAKGLRIFVSNVEAYSGRGKKEPEILSYLKQLKGKSFVACDESTTIKSPDSKRTKHVLKVAAKCDFKRILTGTPITQSPFDAYTQAEFLRKGLLGYTSYFMFTKRYADFKITHMQGRKPFEEVVAYKNLEELKTNLESFSSTILKADCLDLPPKIYQTYNVEATKEQMKAYQDMKDYMMATVDSGEMVVVENALGVLTKLHQILLGHMIDEDGVTHTIKSNRLTAMDNVINECTGKIIIWAQFRRALDDVAVHLGTKYGKNSVVEYHGGVNDADREYAVDAFQDPASPVRFFVGNPQTAGYGLTLTQAHTEIYFSNPYSLEQRMQSEDRPHRPGLMKPLTLVDLVVPGTVDEKVQLALMGKIDIASQVTSLMKGWLR